MTEPASQDFDLLVIGGGINGAGIARDAAGRGLAVCLVEQDDLAAHTSSASTKLIHGGLRYLEQGELRLVREALSERERLLAIAPHIIRPLRFVLPYVDGLRPRWLLRLGLFVYDHAGGRERLAASESLDLAGTAEGAPLRPGMQSGFAYSDCWVEDSRLVVLNARDACDRGACVLLRTQVETAQPEGNGWTVTCRRRDGGQPLRLRARALVNAAGAWVNEVLRQRLGIEPRQHLRLVQGSHLVLPRLYHGDHAYLLQSPDRRVVFAIPYERQYTLIGTTDQPFTGDPARVTITPGEREYLLGCVERFFRMPVSSRDIRWAYSGVRPLFDDGSEASAQSVSRDYHLELQRTAGGAPVLSVYGGKITTYRRLAEAALGLLRGAMPDIRDMPWTDQEPLPGGDLPGADLALFTAACRERYPQLPAPRIQRLAHLYGTRITELLGNARTVGELGPAFGDDLTLAEVRYLVREEWARSADDILWRRTRAGIGLGDSAVHDLQHAVADLLR
ncbi:MAG: glycerol-3-phosphate dehydrogenase [Steroidobacteraceae bacterium]